LNVPASAFTGSSINGRVEAAIPSNLRAVAEPGKSFKWLAKSNTNTPAITATAMLIASTAGLRSIFFQLHLEAGTRSFSENHSADSAGMGIRRIKRATARSKFCWLVNSTEPSARDIAERMERSANRGALIGAQFRRARWRRIDDSIFIRRSVEEISRQATPAIAGDHCSGNAKARSASAQRDRGFRGNRIRPDRKVPVRSAADP